LNQFAAELKVERRRIYDIVNVLEGFDVVAKKGKNLYQWKGLEGFSMALRKLENTAKEDIPELKVFSFESKDPKVKKKSLTFLSIKLLKLFIIYKTNINFKELIKLFGEKYLELKLNNDDKELKKSENKNKIRRLYDIVNVFKSLGLIEKVINSSGKSVFQFRGVDGLMSNVTDLQTVSIPQENEPLSNASDKSEKENLVRVVVFNELDDTTQVTKRKLQMRSGKRNLERFINKDGPRTREGNLDLKRIKQSSYFENIALNKSTSPVKMSGRESFKKLNNEFTWRKLELVKPKLPESLARLEILKKNKNISIINSKNLGGQPKDEKKFRKLTTQDLSPEIQKELKLSVENKEHKFFNIFEHDNSQFVSTSKNRFLDLKKKFLTSKIGKLKGTLLKIQKNYFEEEHEPFFAVLLNCMDNAYRFM
jgi:hypothetical protein